MLYTNSSNTEIKSCFLFGALHTQQNSVIYDNGFVEIENTDIIVSFSFVYFSFSLHHHHHHHNLFLVRFFYSHMNSTFCISTSSTSIQLLLSIYISSIYNVYWLLPLRFDMFAYHIHAHFEINIPKTLRRCEKNEEKHFLFFYLFTFSFVNRLRIELHLWEKGNFPFKLILHDSKLDNRLLQQLHE